ncbi:MAG TPA: GntR family transcriptional regulator [Planctomycetota bacterium]|nr:GntR family transcriptional regulator [Planctomycetota bacterium]
MAAPAVSLSPIRRNSLTQEVITRLRAAILAGELAPGTPLPETHTAQKLGVSRVPVREALVELERVGLVQFSGHGRACVRTFTDEDVHEILSLRATLQTMAARLAAARLTDEDLGRLEAILVRTSRTVDLTEFSRLDAAFHDEIVAIARHRQLVRVWNDLRAQMELWLARLHRQRDRARHDVRKATLQAHRKMLDTLATRRPEAAAELMERHCQSWTEHLPS